MHAVVVNVEISDPDGAAIAELNEQVIAEREAARPASWPATGSRFRAGRAPRSPYSRRSPLPQALAGGVEPPPQGSVTIESVTVGEVVASA